MRVSVLRGHTGRITGVDFSADAKLVLTLSKDESARTWIAATGRPAGIIGGNPADDHVESAAFSPDGGTIVTTGERFGPTTNQTTFTGPAAAVWPAEGTSSTDDADVVVNVLYAAVGDAAFSPDGTHVVVGFNDTAILWDVAGATRTAVLRGHTDRVEEVAFSPDGSLILTVSVDGTARLWQALTGHPFAVLRSAAGDVTSAAFSPNGRAVVTSEGNDATVWSIAGARGRSRPEPRPEARERCGVQPGRPLGRHRERRRDSSAVAHRHGSADPRARTRRQAG